MKLMTYNLESGMQNTSWPKQLRFWKSFTPHRSAIIDAVGKIIKDNDIDVITLTEIDAGSFRTKSINQAEEIAKGTGYDYVFFPTFDVFGFGNQGNGIISRYKIVEHYNHPLPGKGEKRFLGEATIIVNKKNVKIFVTHLAYTPKARNTQIRYIADILNRTTEPFILSGDFNAEDGFEDFKFDECKRIKTFPSWNPSHCLDHIFYKSLKNKNVSTIDTKASDHVPIIAEFN